MQFSHPKIETSAPGAPLDELLQAALARFDRPPTAHSIGRRLADAYQLPRVQAAAVCGMVLLDAGFIPEAEAIFRAAAQFFPRAPAGPAGLAQIAMQRGAWAEALVRWDRVLEEFPDGRNPGWLAARAQTLFQLGRADEARLACEQAMREFPRHPAGLVALAQLAMREKNWNKALDQWDEVLSRFNDQAGRPWWEAARATTLAELGQIEAGLAALRASIAAHPDHFNPFCMLLNLLIRTGRQAEALQTLEASPFRDIDTSLLVALRIRILTGLRRPAEARSVFACALQGAGGVKALETLFELLPSLYEDWPRTEKWLALRDKLDSIASPEDSAMAAPIEMLRARIHLALRDHTGFLAAADRLQPHASGRLALAVAEALREPTYPNFSKPKIFGIGLTKTGTTTLASALTVLGWTTLDWRNPLTFELMSKDDLHLFDAFTDTPVCLDFEAYYYMFPNSKFIYTTRSVAAWLTSIERQWKLHFGLSGFAAIKEATELPDTLPLHGITFRNLYRTLYFNHADFPEAYRAHDRRVRRFFADKPKERFLEFDVFRGDGWSELCAFIGCDIPGVPFPWENRTFAI
jgi:tetratricopeptide (TPR) repeat protein